MKSTVWILNFFLLAMFKNSNGNNKDPNSAQGNCYYESKTGELLCTNEFPGDSFLFVKNFTTVDFISTIKSVHIVNTDLSIHSKSLIAQYSENVEIILIKNCKNSLLTILLDDMRTFSFQNLIKFSIEIDFSKKFTKIPCQEIETINSFLFQLSKSAPNLKYLSLINAGLCNYETDDNQDEIILNFYVFPKTTYLDLSFNRLEKVPRLLPTNLAVFNISHNHISKMELTESRHTFPFLTTFDASFNKLQSMPSLRAEKLVNALFSNNAIESLNIGTLKFIPKIENLHINGNKFKKLDGKISSSLPALKMLNASDNPIDNLSQFDFSKKLEIIDLSKTNFETLDVRVFVNLHLLRILLLEHCRNLRFFGGNVASLRSLNFVSFKNSSMQLLPADFFESAKKPLLVDVSQIEWRCDCTIKWLSSVPHHVITFLNENSTFCVKNGTSWEKEPFDAALRFNKTECLLGTIQKNGSISRAAGFGADALLDCGLYGDPFPEARWYRAEEVDKMLALENDPSEPKYTFYPDGTLRVHSVDKWDVGVYLCVYKNKHGNSSIYQRLRLDLAKKWWLMKVFSLICGILTAFAFFALNVIYGAIRRLIVWRISKLERTSRFRMLLESIEKYRSKQMVNLQDMYTSNINQVRDNYHQQVETLRKNYSAQVGRFRDYKTARMEHVQHHLDAVRDNYNSQVNRLRDYGGRQMERIWESYQRRVTTLRDYSLQQRVRLMRQYKVKQRYFNKLMEGLSLENHTGSAGRYGTKTGVAPEFIEMQCVESDDMPGSSTFYCETFEFNDFAPRKASINSITGEKSGKVSSEDNYSSYHSILDEISAVNMIVNKTVVTSKSESLTKKVEKKDRKRHNSV